MEITDQLVALLEPHANPVKAAPMRAYMKDHFDYLGITTPERRALTMPAMRAAKDIGREDLLATARELWLLPKRDYQYVALDLLARYSKMLSPADLDALLGLVREKSWWDSVDSLAHTIGDILQRHLTPDRACQRAMDAWLADEHLWVRRVAMLHQNRWRGDTDTKRLFHYARTLAPEKDFFIRKAIGWALREHAKHDPDAIRSFLASEEGRFSGLTVREAAKHL